MGRLFISLGLAFLVVAACDRPEPQKAPVSQAPATERPAPVRWDQETGGFELAGKPLRAVKLWTFDGSTEGYTARESELVPAEDVGLRVNLVDTPLRSPRGLAVDGSHYTLVLVRLTRLKAGGAWNGALHYSTPQHGESAEFLGKPVLGADPTVGETTILVYDMGRQTVGGEDWKTSLIDQIRLDLEDQPSGEFLIHQIAIAEGADLTAFLAPGLRPALPPP